MRPTSAPGCRRGWSSTAACPRPRSTAARAPSTQLSGLTVAALTVLTLLFLTGLFEDLPEAVLAAVVIAAVVELVDIASLRRALPGLDPPLGRSTAAPPGSTSSPPSRPCWACSSSTPCPGCSSASRSRFSCCSTAPRGRMSPASPASAEPGPVWVDVDRASGRRPSRCRRRCGSSPGCSSPTPTTSATGSVPWPPTRWHRAVSSTPRRSRHRRHRCRHAAAAQRRSRTGRHQAPCGP